MPLFVLVVTGLLSALGMAIDGANLFAAQRAAQGAADIAALAGALDLPSAPAAASSSAQANLARNGHGASGDVTVAVTTPYSSDSRSIEVRVTKVVRTYFLPLVGVQTFTVVGRAVARNGQSGYAIFAGRHDCPAGDAHETITVSGSNTVIGGDVHSNSGIKVSGTNNDFDGSVTYKCTGRLELSGSGNTFGSGPSVVALQPWPVTYSAASLPCTYNLSNGVDIGSDDGPWWMPPGKSSNHLRDGVYCVTGTIKLSGSNITGRITMLAKGSSGETQISGSNTTLTPYWNDVLTFSEGTGPDAGKMSGSGGAWQGLMYAPNGRVNISGSTYLSVSGRIVAQTVVVSGSDWTLSSSGVGSGGPALVE